MSQHKRRFGWYLSFAVLVQMLVAGVAWAQVKSYTPGEYPAPKDPPYKLDATVEELLPIARVLVRKPAERQPLEPGYGIKPGQRVLILVASTFDDRVLEAIRRAIEELGGRPDIMKSHTPQRAKVTKNQGHEEIGQIAAVESTPQAGRFAFPQALQAASNASPYGEYDLVINGGGGSLPETPYGWEYIPWDTVDKFMFSQASFPYEVQKALDQKAWNLLLSSRKIHATDPEGTDMTWNWHPHFAGLIREEWPGYDVVLTGHLGTFPEFLSPPDAEANGTIGGTINHTGTFPHMMLTVRNNDIVKIEGGGEYGERWQEKLKACRGIQFPGFPAAGCGWFEEAALGSDVWRARSLWFADYTREASWERGRSGVIHWGLGVSRHTAALPAVAKWYEEHPGPAGHEHVHTYFNTVDFTLSDGKQFRIVDKGHMTLLDEPEIRQLAAKYGDPDAMLREKWIPAVPGINVPGNYMADYGQDPHKVIAAQQAELMRNRQASQSQPVSGTGQQPMEASVR